MARYEVTPFRLLLNLVAMSSLSPVHLESAPSLPFLVSPATLSSGLCSILLPIIWPPSCHYRTATAYLADASSDHATNLGRLTPRRFLHFVWRWLHVEDSPTISLQATGCGQMTKSRQCLNKRERPASRHRVQTAPVHADRMRPSGSNLLLEYRHAAKISCSERISPNRS